MATTNNFGLGFERHEVALYAPTYREAPSFYQDSTTKGPVAKAETIVHLYDDTEAHERGIPIFVGGTVSRHCATLAERAAELQQTLREEL